MLSIQSLGINISKIRKLEEQRQKEIQAKYWISRDQFDIKLHNEDNSKKEISATLLYNIRNYIINTGVIPFNMTFDNLYITHIISLEFNSYDSMLTITLGVK